MKKNKLDKYRGCLVGLAVGDALGTTIEFMRPGTFEPVTNIVGGGPFNLQPGEWTDDTSMALCLGASLIDCGGFNPCNQLNRYVNWREYGYMSSNGECFDIGNTVNSSLNAYLSSREPYRTNNPYSAGNGSLMRLAPIPMFYNSELTEMVDFADKSSKTTHNADEANDACKYYGSMIFMALAGKSKEQITSARLKDCTALWNETELCDSILEIADGSYKTKNPPAIVGTGYVVKSMEAALWAFYLSDNFEEGALLAVNLGDDADTTGAIYGQLAGAYYGYHAIPEHWTKVLCKAQMIMQMADKLMEGSTKK